MLFLLEKIKCAFIDCSRNISLWRPFQSNEQDDMLFILLHFPEYAPSQHHLGREFPKDIASDDLADSDAGGHQRQRELETAAPSQHRRDDRGICQDRRDRRQPAPVAQHPRALCADQRGETAEEHVPNYSLAIQISQQAADEQPRNSRRREALFIMTARDYNVCLLAARKRLRASFQ